MIAIFPEIAAASAQGDVERLAILVRKYFAGASVHAPKIDMASLLIVAGVDVQRLPLSGGTVAALLAKDERGTFNIVAVLKAVEGRAEQGSPAERFLLAHMLGHFLFDIQPLIARGDLQVSGYRESLCPLKRYSQGGMGAESYDQTAAAALKKEERADDFAAAVLLPQGMTKKAFMSFKGDIERTAAFFGVTKACLGRRLTQLGILGASPMSFLDAEQALGNAPMSSTPDPMAEKDLDEEQLKAMQKAAGEHSVPRAFAASTYGQTEKTTGHAPTKNPASNPPRNSVTKQGSSPSSGSQSVPTEKAKPGGPQTGGAQLGGLGMERIRELARRLDKSK